MRGAGARAGALGRGRRARRRATRSSSARPIGSAPTRSPSAHTRDDQAETFLLRLLRGAGTRGLAGILPRAGRVVRPLLDVSRADLRQYAAAHGSCVPRGRRATPTSTIPRNRVRHELLPYLEHEFSPGDRGRARARGGARARGRGLSAAGSNRSGRVRIVLSRCRTSTTSKLTPRRSRRCPPRSASRVAQTGAEAPAPARFIGFDHVERLLRFARDGAAGLGAEPAGAAGRAPGRPDRAAAPEPRAREVGRRRTLSRFRCLFQVRSRSTRPGWAISAEPLPQPAGRRRRVPDRRAGREVAVAAGALEPAAGGAQPAAGRPVPAARARRARQEAAGLPGRSEDSRAKRGIPCRSWSTATTESCGSSGSRWRRIFASRTPHKA